MESTTSGPGMGVKEVPNVKVGETIGVVVGVETAVNILKLGVRGGMRTTSILIPGDIKIIGDMLGSHWYREDESLVVCWL